MDYRIFHENLIREPDLQQQFRKKLNRCASQLEELPVRYRKEAVWAIRLFRYEPHGYRMQVEMDWSFDKVQIVRQGEDLLQLTDELLVLFLQTLSAQVRKSGESRDFHFEYNT